MSEPDAATGTAGGSTGHQLARNAFFLLASQIVSSVLSLILTAALARGLGVVEFGNYYLVMAIATFAFVVIEWGQSAYLVREAARWPDRSGTLLGDALAVRVAMATVVALATAMLATTFWNDSRAQGLALLAVACGLPLLFSQTYVVLFRGRERMDLDAAVTVAGKALTVAATVPALLLGGGLVAVLLMQAIGGTGALLVAIALAYRIDLKAARPDRGRIVELVRGGAPLAVFFLALAAQPFLDAIVLSRLAPPEVVGWYGAARNVMGLLFVPAQILGAAAFPELSRVAGSLPDLRRAISASLRLLAGLGALAAVGTYLFAGVAVELIYGRGRFDPAVVVLQVFAAVLPMLFLGTLFGTTLTAMGKTKQIAVVKVVSLAVSTGLAILLIPWCQSRFGNGGIGLALAIGAAETLMLPAFLCLLPRGAMDGRGLWDVLRAAGAAAATAVVFRSLPEFTPWLAMPGCVMLFAVLSYALGLIRRSDLDMAGEIIRSKAGGKG